MSKRKHSWRGLGLVLLTAVAVAMAIAFAGARSAAAASVVPTQMDGNPTCADLGLTAELGYIEIKVDPPVSGTYQGITVTFVGGLSSVNFSAGFPIEAVIVKGGNEGANIYDYPSPGATSDTGLTTPTVQDISHVSFCVKPQLAISKTANTTWDRDWDWTIDKSADKTEVGPFADTQVDGGEVEYTIELTATKTESRTLSGTITINNPFGVAASITSISDVLTPPGAVTLGGDCAGLSFPYALAAGATLNCTWSADSPTGSETLNTVNVATSGVVAGGSATAPISWSLNETDECVALDDSLFPGSVPDEVCTDDLDVNNKWSVKFTIDFAEYANGECGDFTNVADFETSDQDGESDDTGNDDHTVTVLCADNGCTLTPGYWKTHADPTRKQFDETWLLLPLGPNTLFDGGPNTYLQVLNISPGGNVYYILAHAYIAAQLNILAGADGSAIASAMTSAASFFALHSPASAALLKGAAKSAATALAATLDNYNNGLTGPGHCDF